MENKNESTIIINDITANIMLDECDKLKEHATIEDQYSLNAIRNMLQHYVVRKEAGDESLISDPVCERISQYNFTILATREVQKAFVPLIKRMIDYAFLYGGFTREFVVVNIMHTIADIASYNILELDDCKELFDYINNFKGCEGVDLLSIYKHSQVQLNKIKNKIMEELKNA